jgi:hypothetical protein
MDNERELLALAAKAAGKKRHEWDFWWLAEQRQNVARDMLWDPRRDSGQALELAVLRDIALHFDDVAGVEAFCSAGHFTITTDGALSKIEATREVIFDAAVAIGRAMP